MKSDRTHFGLAIAVWAIGTLIGLNFVRLGWTLDDRGLSVMTGRLPYWDFTNLWGGGRMALEGNVGYLFDPQLYRPELRAMLSPLMLDQEWSYPPSMLLIGTPLAMLPILAAYLVWTGAGLLFLFGTAGWLGLPLGYRLALLTAPPVLLTVLLGQNGAFTAALLLGGLILAPSRPVVAGILFGLLTMKPHLGILVPFCLLAAGNWRAVLSAGITTTLIVVTTGALFGWNVWSQFLAETNPLMRSIMEAPYPQGYHMNAMTFFIMVRSLGGGLALAYLVQIALALAAIGTAIWLWRPATVIEPAVKVALTGILTLCATPYGYTYDAAPLSIAVLVLWSRNLVPASLLTLGWLYPAVNHMVAQFFPSIGALVCASVASAALIALRSRQQQDAKASAATPSR
jgi:hypothetical protein